MVEGCYSKKIKFNRKKNLKKKFYFYILFSTSANHLHNIELFYSDFKVSFTIEELLIFTLIIKKQYTKVITKDKIV